MMAKQNKKIDLPMLKHQNPMDLLPWNNQHQEKLIPNTIGRRIALSKVNNNSDLVTSMASRLSQLEKTTKSLRKELIHSEKERMKLQVFKNSHPLTLSTKEGIEMDVSAVMQQLQDENEQLKTKIYQMEQFLADYGMIWADSESQSHNDTPSYDLSLIVQRLKELNETACKQQITNTKIGSNEKVVKFQPPPAIPLCIYKDGLFIKKGPLRPYSHPAAQAFIQDVLDGYIPEEFKLDYPNGVTFDISDCHTNNSNDSFKAFRGSGNKISDSKTTMLSSIGGNSLTMKTPEFLSLLPETVVSKDGKVVHVRKSMEKTLVDCKQTTETVIYNAEQNNLESDSISKLRVKSETGEKSILLHLPGSSTIKQLRETLNECRPTISKYEICTTFPTRVLNDETQTLIDAGLVPSATLFLKPMS